MRLYTGYAGGMTKTEWGYLNEDTGRITEIGSGVERSALAEPLPGQVLVQREVTDWTPEIDPNRVAARYALVEILDDNFPAYKGCYKKCIHHANQPEEFHELADAILESAWLRERRALAWEEGFEAGRGFDQKNPYESGDTQ